MDLGARLEVVERLGRLRDDGALTNEEFVGAKSAVLQQSAAMAGGVAAEGAPYSFDDDRPNYAKWVAAATLVATVVGGAYYILPQFSGDSETPAAVEAAENTATVPETTEPSDAESALNDAANAGEEAGTAVEEAVVDTDISTTTETEVKAQPPTSEVSYQPREAKPVRDLKSYVSSDDYPSSSIQRGEQGSVGFTLTIGTSGRATDCSITASSGFRALDTATCNIMTRRARFTPAYDATGTPVVGSVSSTIGWRLAD